MAKDSKNLIDEELEKAAMNACIIEFQGEPEPSQHAYECFISGTKFQAEREKKEKQIFRDAIAEVIRNSHDIMAKKVCSRALAEVEGSHE